MPRRENLKNYQFSKTQVVKVIRGTKRFPIFEDLLSRYYPSMLTLRRLVRILKDIASLPNRISKLEQEVRDIKPILANLLFEIRERLPNTDLKEARIFSQFGEDGLIFDVLSKIKLDHDMQRFVEIGVENYSEANTRALLTVLNWKGLVIDNQKSEIETIKASELSWRYGLTAIQAHIDRDNINQIIQANHFDSNLGLLSLDIDGNDYWVWQALTCVRPAVIVIEYNSLFGPNESVVVPYDPNFDRTKAHSSWVYWGASLKALLELGRSKQYEAVASNSAGNNIIFVEQSYAHHFKKPDPEQLYREPAFREARSANGAFSRLAPREALREIGKMPVQNIATNSICSIDSLAILRNL